VLKFYSYQDCKDYFLSLLPKNANLSKEQARDLITLCQTAPAKF